jgi:hypothetical protein
LRHGAQRLAGGQDHDRQHEQRQRRSASQHAGAHAHRADEQAQAEQPVDDRRHGGEIRDVDLDCAADEAAAAVLLEVDGRATPTGTASAAVTRITKMLPVSACQMPA